MRKTISCFYFFFISLGLSHPLFAAQNVAKKTFGSIQTIVLHGSHEQMGIQYGKNFRKELHEALAILNDFYITKNRLSYKKLRDQAESFYQRFPLSYQRFIIGISHGSGLSLDDAKILNAMETLGQLLPRLDNKQKCAFLSIPANKTSTNALLIGRNYDFPPPFDQLAKYVTVTVLQEENAVPTAFISIIGEIYCPTCVNAKGLFVELNNGMPSGGDRVDTKRETLLIHLLHILQNSTDLKQLQKQLNATQSDFSLIINTANKTTVQSYEFSSTLGMKTVFPMKNTVFASTNFYLNQSWCEIPKPTDATTWLGVTRRKNLLNLADQSSSFDIASFEALMDKKVSEGGAIWHSTIYQIIVDMSNLTLYIKINHQAKTWSKIPLIPLFHSSS